MLNVTNVDEISRSLQHFGWPDYLVFSLMLLSCMIIGVYFGYQDHQKHKKSKHLRRDSEAQEYLVGGRNMKIFPVAMSLVASWISGISLLGTSTEIYVYGTQYCYIFIAIIIMGIVMYYIYIPIFHELQITSTYEYLQIRFDRRIRFFASILFTVGTVLWLPIVIYVPAIAFNQVTGVNIHIISPIVCLVCVFYTVLGGLKAVIWTDVIQTVIMLCALLLVIFKGTLNTGGLTIVMERNFDSGRLEWPNLSLDPTIRHTFWSLAVGYSFSGTYTVACSQSMVQRFLSLPTQKKAKTAAILFTLGMLTFYAFTFYIGLLAYATYYDCDPITTQLAKVKDQIVPVLVMNVLGNVAGFPGMFVAGVFSAALSSMSTALNSLSAVFLEDFVKPFTGDQISEKFTNFVMRGTVVLIGLLALSMIFIVEKLGTVLQLSMSMTGLCGGPMLGMFTMGVFMPWVNGHGALTGGISSLIIMAYITFRAQAAIAMGEMVFDHKPLSVEGCTYDFVPKNMTTVPDHQFQKSIHHMSYCYYGLVGTAICCLIGNIVSFATGCNKISSVNQNLLAPCIRRFFTNKKIENYENCETVKHVFEMKDNNVID